MLPDFSNLAEARPVAAPLRARRWNGTCFHNLGLLFVDVLRVGTLFFGAYIYLYMYM